MVKLEVKVVGFPKPETKWVKDGSELFASEEYQIENLEDGTSILVINDVYPDDTGEIKFEAYNTLGVAETVTHFVVEGTFITDHQHFNNLHILLLFNKTSIQFNDIFFSNYLNIFRAVLNILSLILLICFKNCFITDNVFQIISLLLRIPVINSYFCKLFFQKLLAPKITESQNGSQKWKK